MGAFVVRRVLLMLLILFLIVLTVANLRGVKESGRAFAVPTYGFVVVILLIGGAVALVVIEPNPPVRHFEIQVPNERLSK